MVNEYSGLNTGYSVYGRNLFKELHKTGKYELAELSCYLHQGDSSCKQFPWRCYPNVPHPEDKQNHQVYTSDPTNSFGKWNFERVCLDFKPDIVIGFKDFWMEKFIQESPFRKYFRWGWMCPSDGVAIEPEWLSLYSQVDGLFCYNDWSKDCLEKSGLKVEGVPSPVAEECFRPFDKKKLKEDFGLANTKIVGVVSRNQARKLFPDILKSFRELLNRTKRQDILLYLHAQIYDQGWDIAELLKENGLTSKVILSYICRSCGFCFPGHYADDLQTCKRCHQRNVHSAGVQAGFPSEVLAQVYGIMDVMVQWSTCLTGDQEILTEECWKPIKDVNIGDNVYTHNGNYSNVTNKFYGKSESVIELGVWSDFEKLEITDEHPVLAITKELLKTNNKWGTRRLLGKYIQLNKKIPEPIFVPASELKIGDLIAYKINVNVTDKDIIDLAEYCDDNYTITDCTIMSNHATNKIQKPRFINIDNDFCKFIGLFAADGYSGVDSTKITSSNKDYDNIELSCQVLKKIGTLKTRKYKNKEAIDVYINSRPFSRLLRDICYNNNKEKKLPNWCMELPLEKQKSIITGLFMGDGHKYKDANRSMFFTTSKELCDQIKTILKRLGVTYNVARKDRSKDNRKTAYRFRISGDIKHERFDNNLKNSSCLNIDGYYYLKLKSIKQSKSDDVYNIEVENDNSYTTKIGHVHNCEGFGMPMVESAACGTPIVNVGYTAMVDVGEKLNGEVIEPLSYYKDVSTKRLFAVPNNEKLVDYLEEFFNLPTSLQSLKGMDARQGFEEHYGSWEKSAKIWESWIDKTEQATPWNSTPNILQSAHPSQCPPNLSNSDFVKWCILYVLGEPEMLHSFFHLRVLKDTNHGFVINGLHRSNIGRNEIYNMFKSMRDKINYFEQQRAAK